MTKPVAVAAIKRLVAAGESETLELKRSTGELREAVRTLCGFLNERGGVVVIGVAPDRRLVGQEVSDGTLRDVATAVRDIDPAPQVDVQRLDVGGGRSVIVLSVNGGGAVPYTYDGRAFIRIGNTTRRMRREEYERLLLSRLHAQHRWETLPATGWTIDNLDADEIRLAVAEAVAAKRLAAVPTERAETTLRRLNLLVDRRPTQAAIVLFGKEPMPQYPQCAIRLARFRGVTKSEFIDNRQFHGHAFALLRQADAFFDMHLAVASRIIPGQMRREDRPQYPPEALREALVNALCHRDYSEAGASVGVSIFDDRLEVWSWGRLPGDLTPEQLRSDHPSIRRNDLVADVFYRRGYIEKWGRGTQNIIDACRRAGLREAEFIERAGEVGVRFWSAFNLPSLEAPSKVTARQQRSLDTLAERGICSLADVVAAAGGKVTERTVQRDLETLRAQGLVELTGRGRGARYRLASKKE
ncbi:MAG: putative DNA binding domain-containing protein [Deltaproteobacteria bacterium]|nr:putative DNA binding domain-containing protein [Deltaproteobacteria bacterium]